MIPIPSGGSSVVERRLAKAKAVGSNPIPRSIPLIILIAALFLASLACSHAAEDLISLAEDLETIAAPTPGPAVRPLDQSPPPIPTKSSTPEPVGTPTPASTPSPIPEPVAILTLMIAEIPADVPDYDRDHWGRWRDEDGDCQDTRQEVLLEESLVDVDFKSAEACRVATGRWLAPFTGAVITDPGKLDIDHMVPLANAHRSGGWDWPRDRKRAYADFLDAPVHLVAVTASANRSKGSRGPDEWRPLDPGYWCAYARNWISIKQRWELAATSAEFAALGDMVATCDNQVQLHAAK